MQEPTTTNSGVKHRLTGTGEKVLALKAKRSDTEISSHIGIKGKHRAPLSRRMTQLYK